MSDDKIGRDLITIVHNRMVKEIPVMIRECLGLLTDEQLWWRPNDTSNSIGNLVIHLCGSTRHFMGRGIGGSDYVRDRDKEFAEKGPIPRAALVTLFDGTVAEVDKILTGLTPARLLEPSRNIETDFPVMANLLRMSHHWAYHAGQIVFTAKMLREGSVTDLFRKTMVK